MRQSILAARMMVIQYVQGAIARTDPIQQLVQYSYLWTIGRRPDGRRTSSNLTYFLRSQFRRRDSHGIRYRELLVASEEAPWRADIALARDLISAQRWCVGPATTIHGQDRPLNSTGSAANGKGHVLSRLGRLVHD